MSGETTQKHIAFKDNILDEIKEIAEREGRQDYDVIREAVADYINRKQTKSVYFDVAPDDGHIRPGDRAKNLNFDEMWTSEEGDIDNLKDGDTVRCLQVSLEFFDFYKFYKDGETNTFVCSNHTRIKVDAWTEITERAKGYYDK